MLLNSLSKEGGFEEKPKWLVKQGLECLSLNWQVLSECVLLLGDARVFKENHLLEVFGEVAYCFN